MISKSNEFPSFLRHFVCIWFVFEFHSFLIFIIYLYVLIYWSEPFLFISRAGASRRIWDYEIELMNEWIDESLIIDIERCTWLHSLYFIDRFMIGIGGLVFALLFIVAVVAVIVDWIFDYAYSEMIRRSTKLNWPWTEWLFLALIPFVFNDFFRLSFCLWTVDNSNSEESLKKGSRFHSIYSIAI